MRPITIIQLKQTFCADVYSTSNILLIQNKSFCTQTYIYRQATPFSYKVRPPRPKARPVKSSSSRTVTSKRRRSTRTSTANIKPPRPPVSGLRKLSKDAVTQRVSRVVRRGTRRERVILSPSAAIAPLTVANTSTRRALNAAPRSASSPSWRGLTSAGERAMAERLETGVRPLMDVVTLLIASVKLVSSEPTDVTAAALSASEEEAEMVARVASVSLVSYWLLSLCAKVLLTDGSSVGLHSCQEVGQVSECN